MLIAYDHKLCSRLSGISWSWKLYLVPLDQASWLQVALVDLRLEVERCGDVLLKLRGEAWRGDGMPCWLTLLGMVCETGLKIGGMICGKYYQVQVLKVRAKSSEVRNARTLWSSCS